MRYDTEHKRNTRRRVLSAAARALRRDGPERLGIAAVMARAGLTHGGFYAHFGSKDELIAAAIAHMFERAAIHLERMTSERTPREALGVYIDFYLSAEHCAARESGCPMAALASDLPRLDAAARQAFVDGMRRLQGRLSGLLTEAGVELPVARARAMTSELVGALTLARIETDTRLARQMLATSRKSLKQTLGLEAWT